MAILLAALLGMSSPVLAITQLVAYDGAIIDYHEDDDYYYEDEPAYDDLELEAIVDHLGYEDEPADTPNNLTIYEQFLQNVELFPALWDAETGRTGAAFQWTGNETHDLVGTTWNERPNRDNDFNIVEEVFIELPIDTDGDGKRDLIRATIRRPVESERVPGLRIPAFLEVSPYRDGTLTLTVVDITRPRFAAPDTSHFTFADVESLLPRAADWPWDRDEAIYWDVDARVWRTGTQAATLDIGVIPAARPAVAPENVVTRGNPVPATGGGGHTNHGGTFAQYMFVRGYAVVATNSVGNVFSDGFTSTGGICETLSSIAAIQWLNGNARAFTCQNAIYEVDATSWSNGMVAMAGVSYNGTLPIAAAATGVEGLGLIIPQAAISNWYYYHRGSGTVMYPGRNNAWHAGFPGEEASDLALLCFTRRGVSAASSLNAIARDIPSFVRFHADTDEGRMLRANADAHWAAMIEAEDIASGNYNRFWDDRNYLATADRITAGIIMQHALNDFNVMPRHFDVFYRAVAEHSNAEMRVVLNRSGHSGFHTHDALFDWQHLWFDHFLNGIPNNALDMPKVQIQSSVTGAYESFDSWPIAGAAYRRYFLTPSWENPTNTTGTLGFAVPESREFTIQDAQNHWNPRWNATAAPAAGSQFVSPAFFDRDGGVGAIVADGTRASRLANWERALFNVNNLGAQSTERLAFVIDIEEDVRMSGTIVASIEAASDRPFGNISAALVEIRPASQGRTFGTGAAGAGAGINTHIVRTIPAHNGVGAINILAPNPPVNPSGNNFWIDYKKLTMGHADIQNPNQTDIITVCDFHTVAEGFEGLTRGRTYMEAGHQNFIPNFYFQSIIPEPGEFNTYVFSFQTMDWEFEAGTQLAIMVFTTDYRYTLTPENPPEVTIRTGANTFVDIPSISPLFVEDELVIEVYENIRGELFDEYGIQEKLEILVPFDAIMDSVQRTEAIESYIRARFNLPSEISIIARLVSSESITETWEIAIGRGATGRIINLDIITFALTTSPADFIRIGETARNSRQWAISFWVTQTFSDISYNRFESSFTLPGANANHRGAYVFGEGHILEGCTILYDIRNNGSNVVTFELR